MISSKRGTESCRVLGSVRLRAFFVLVLVLVLPLFAVTARADILGSAASYAVLAQGAVTAVTNADPSTVINGNIGVPIFTACTGLPAPCTGPTDPNITGAINAGAVAAGANADSFTAYGNLAATPSPVGNHEGTASLGSLGLLPSLAPGVYQFTGAVTSLLGQLTLAGGGAAAPLWIFQIAGQLTTGSNSSVVVTGAGAASAGIYWEVGSQATLGVNSIVQGNFLAGSEVVFDPGAQITCGRAFAETTGPSEVTFAGPNTVTPFNPNLVNAGPCGAGTTGSPNGNDNGVIITLPTGGTGVGPGTPVATTPEPGTFVLLGFGIAGLLGLAGMKRARRASPALLA
jgi:hypothetical protein